MHFQNLNHPSGRPILARNVYFGATYRPQLQCRRPHFWHFFTQWLSEKKLPSFSFLSNFGQIWRAVQSGEKSNLPGHCTVLELRGHATEV